MSLDGPPQAVGTGDPVLVHERQAGLERWKVGEHDGGSIIGRQRLVQPLLSNRVESAVVTTRDRGVQTDEADREPVDDVAAVVRGHVVGEQVGEGQPERRTLIVVTGQRNDPLSDGGQRFTEDGVLGWSAVIGQVAGGQDNVRGGFQGQQVIDHPPEGLGGVDEPAEVVVMVSDVAVGDLGDQHGSEARAELGR